MPLIRLSVAELGNVQIELVGEVSAIDWSRVANAFSSRVIQLRGTQHISVPAVRFVARIRWLRSWERDGGLVEYTEDIKSLVAGIRMQTEAFENLTRSDPDRHAGKELIVPGIKLALRPEQVENVFCLLDMPNGANFSVPGAGKTITTLALSRMLTQRGVCVRLLVVCPRSAMESWSEEAGNSFEGPVSLEVFEGQILDQLTKLVLVNYEQLENPTKRTQLLQWLKAMPTHLVIDEAHRIKGGARSVRWRACREVAARAVRVDILTGTPMPNGPEDVRALFEVTWPHLSPEFLEDRKIGGLKRKTVFVRTTKRELDLPSVTFETLVGKPSPIHREILNALKDNYVGRFSLSQFEGKALARRGKAVMTLLAATTNPGLLIRRDFEEIEFGFSWPPREIADNATLASLVSDYLNVEEPWKYRQVVDMAEKLSREGKKLLVWSSFVGNLAGLNRYLTKYKPALIYGNVNSDERALELQRFRSDPSCSVLLTNPQTLGEGVSLHRHCHDAVYVDRTFNAGHYLQSVDRIHRLGLPAGTKTNITFLQTDNSIDGRVGDRLAKKVKSLAQFLDDDSLVQASIPSGEEVPAEEALGLTDEDFATVMAYLQEAK